MGDWRGWNLNDRTIKVMFAMTMLTILEVANICITKHDGIILGSVIAGICGLAGFILGKKEK